MKVCYLGTYHRDYSRNQILIKGLQKNGVEVIECHVSVWGEVKGDKTIVIRGITSKLNYIFRYLLGYLRLSIKYLRLSDHDLVIVGYPGHLDMFVAKLLTSIRKKPLVFDAFLSLYDLFVSDKQIIKRGSWRAKIIFLIDKYACKLADKILLDTDEHINYFHQQFGIRKENFARILVGADDDIFQPINGKELRQPTELSGEL